MQKIEVAHLHRRFNAAQENVLVDAEDALDMAATICGAAIECHAFLGGIIVVNEAAGRHILGGQFGRRGSADESVAALTQRFHTQPDAELARVIAAWPDLPAHVRQTIPGVGFLPNLYSRPPFFEQ